MGNGDSKEDARLKAAISKVNKVELKDLEAVFLELATKTDEGEDVIYQPTWLNRDKFAQVLGTNEFLIEELFAAFDRDNNGVVDLQEFITGMALCLHGSIKSKCNLLFRIFNLNGDDGIDAKELSLVLTNCLQSAHTLLRKTSVSQGLTSEDEELVLDQASEAALTHALVEKIVKDAFEKCDLSHTGKLNIDEFANWVHKHPKLINNVFVMQCPKLQETGHANPSFVDAEDGENDGAVSERTSSPQGPIQGGKVPPPSLKDLFSQESKADSSDFFDTIGSSQEDVFDSLQTSNDSALSVGDRLGNPAVPPPPVDALQQRSHSEVFTAKHFAGLAGNEVTSSSQVDLTFTGDQSQRPCENQLANVTSESLYSIALSTNSLCEDPKQQPQTGIQISVSDETAVGSLSEGPQEVVTDVAIGGSAPPQPQQPQSQHMGTISPQVVGSNVVEEVGVECVEAGESQAKLQPSIDSTRKISTSSTTNITSFWQPSIQTLQLLQLAADGKVPEYKLVQPVIAVDTPMTDPVKELVAKYLGDEEASKRPFLNMSTSGEHNQQRLHELLHAQCWRAALDWTKMYIEAHNTVVVAGTTSSRQTPLLSPQILEVWYVRIALLVRLRMFSSAEIEINAFNDFESPDLYYQFYPDVYPGEEGCMVPFSFRLLHAEIPQYNGKPEQSLQRLYSLLSKVTSVHDHLSKGLNEVGVLDPAVSPKELEDRASVWWKRSVQIHYSLVNCFLGMKEYTLSVKLLEKLITLEPHREIPLLSAIGRVFLQLGDCTTAQKYFKRIQLTGNEDKPTLSTVTMNTAYTALTKGQYKEAYQHFLTADAQMDGGHVAACNNAAVCLLFMGKVKEASDILETMVCQSPERSLHEEILLNLTTVYELETSRALQKKHKLLDLVSKHKGDGFNVQCLKLT